MERVIAKYLIETPYSIEDAAAVLAGEQSSGTFVKIPGETEELKARFAARVEKIEPLDIKDHPSIPGDNLQNKKFKRAIVFVSWPVHNFKYNIPTLISTLQGNLYELRQFTGLKLIDFELPDCYSTKFRGSHFGILGTRDKMNVAERPLIGTIIKPSVGLSPGDTAQKVSQLADAGIDFIKDDELMAETENSPFNKRVDKVMDVINSHAQKTGKRIRYAFNISGEIDTMLRRYDKVLSTGNTCAMLSINSIGWAGVKKVCDRGELVIHGHRNGWGMLNRHPSLGIEFPAYQKFWRLAGVDQIHVNGIQNKFWESDESVIQSIKSCQTSFLDCSSILPVVSSGQWGGQAFETYRQTQTTDLLYLAGGGIFGHPLGINGGVKALKQAWAAAVS